MGLDDKEFESSETLLLYEVDGIDASNEEAEEEEAKALLPSARIRADEEDAVMWKNSMTRKVQWNDHKGNRLVEVLEFEPSEKSDSDEEDFFDSCVCSVM